MPICPYCETSSDTPLEPCPTGDGYYCVDGAAYASHPDDPLLGRRIAERFIVSSVLGQGSMGKVYKAHQERVARDVALKVFQSETLVRHTLGRDGTEKEQKAARARFKREAQVLGRLSHPNCVTVYDFGEEDGEFLYMAMEFVAGVSLREAIGRGLKFEAIVDITVQILRALREAHSLGVVHRDLKPDNIVLSYRFNTGEHIVKVLDFGIAKLLQGESEHHTRVGALFGTPAYMSPEQCRGEVDSVGPPADIYALGCILYEMVCGRLPFVADIPQRMVQLHQEAEIPSLYPRQGLKIPDGLADYIERCMAKDADDRFEDAAAALVAFEEILAGAQASGEFSDVRGLGSSMANTIRKRSGTTKGARKVVVPGDKVSGDQLDPIGRGDDAEEGAGLDQPSRKTSDSERAPKGPRRESPPRPSNPDVETLPPEEAERSVNVPDGGRAIQPQKNRSGGIDKRTVLVIAALLVVLASCALIFVLVVKSAG
ncbi:MAG: serine/threonine-protein kinase [Persicimonas sp.]